MKKILLILAFPFITNGQSILEEAKKNSILGKDFYDMKVETEPTDFYRIRERQNRDNKFRNEQRSTYDRFNDLNKNNKIVQPTNRFYTETDNTGKVIGYYEIDRDRIIKRNNQGQIIKIIE